MAGTEGRNQLQLRVCYDNCFVILVEIYQEVRTIRDIEESIQLVLEGAMKADSLAVSAQSGNAPINRESAGVVQTARYIEDMAIGLRKLAQMHEQAVLGMLLEMAALEAARITNGDLVVPPPPRSAPLRTRE